MALPPQTFDILLILIRSAGSLVLRDRIITEVWPDTFVTDANLTNIIVALRKVLGKEAIQTVSKFGYRFTPSVIGEPGVDNSTYETFVRGKELASARSLDSMLRGRDLLWLCLAKDPSFAPGWAWLGRCCRFLEKFKVDPSVNLEIAQQAFQRALALDPNLACAHHFYTQIQADMGEAREAIVRLASRLKQRGDEPESWAGLVQVLRFCGLLDESIEAHKRATELDPTIATSVSHTYFLKCEYRTTIETYPKGARYYLDAAAWAALGETEHARMLLEERLHTPGLSPLMSSLMGSLHAILQNRHQDAAEIMRDGGIEREPEVLFYFARHYAMMDDATETLRMLSRAFNEGFTSSVTLQKDTAFKAIRNHDDFSAHLSRAKDFESATRLAYLRVAR